MMYDPTKPNLSPDRKSLVHHWTRDYNCFWFVVILKAVLEARQTKPGDVTINLDSMAILLASCVPHLRILLQGQWQAYACVSKLSSIFQN